MLITSEPITIQVKIEETKQIDVNDDDINDIEIRLTSIINGKAVFLLNKLSGADIVAKEELGKEALFDAKVTISNLFQIVKSGREVIAKIELLNVNSIGQVDVNVNYYITDKENKTIAQGSDTLAVEAVTSFVRSLIVPYNTKAGTYSFNVEIKYQDNFMASSHAEFKVMRTYEIIIVGGVFLLMVMTGFFYLWRIRRKEEKLEREIRLLKEKWRKKK